MRFTFPQEAKAKADDGDDQVPELIPLHPPTLPTAFTAVATPAPLPSAGEEGGPKQPVGAGLSDSPAKKSIQAPRDVDTSGLPTPTSHKAPPVTGVKKGNCITNNPGRVGFGVVLSALAVGLGWHLTGTSSDDGSKKIEEEEEAKEAMDAERQLRSYRRLKAGNGNLFNGDRK